MLILSFRPAGEKSLRSLNNPEVTGEKALYAQRLLDFLPVESLLRVGSRDFSPTARNDRRVALAIPRIIFSGLYY
jgi:hypothetical protein